MQWFSRKSKTFLQKKNAASSYGCRSIYSVTSEVTKEKSRDLSRICGKLRVNGNESLSMEIITADGQEIGLFYAVLKS